LRRKYQDLELRKRKKRSEIMKIKYLRDIIEWYCDWCEDLVDIVHEVSFNDVYTIRLCGVCLQNLKDFLTILGIEYEEVYE
jgi:hypothetical protein